LGEKQKKKTGAGNMTSSRGGGRFRGSWDRQGTLLVWVKGFKAWTGKKRFTGKPKNFGEREKRAPAVWGS